MIDNADTYGSARDKNHNQKLSAIWNLGYHFYVPQKDLDLLQEQAAKLLACSETPENWAESPYSVIKFVSLQTVEELRKIWMKYCMKRSISEQQKYEKAMRAEIKAVYDSKYATGGESMTFYAGPHWEKGLDTMNKALRGYWNTGVTGGNTDDIAKLGSDRKGVSNPMFMVSSVSEKFVIHFTSDPLTGFHLTGVFDGKEDQGNDVKSMVTLAKSQFSEWSGAFVEYAKLENVEVMVYYGDAVNFSHELAARNSAVPGSAAITRLYTTQWSIKPLLFDGDGGKDLPISFDVIDTSNLADWVGLPNLLPPMSQILARKSTSILYTESFRMSATHTEDDLREALFMEVDLASLVFGVVPLGNVLGYSTENTHGEDLVHLENPNRYRIRIPWKIIMDQNTMAVVASRTQDHRVHFDAKGLSGIFFDIYLKMFEQEDLSKSPPLNGRPMNSKLFSRYR
jgi:hypothetical protein